MLSKKRLPAIPIPLFLAPIRSRLYTATASLCAHANQLKGMFPACAWSTQDMYACPWPAFGYSDDGLVMNACMHACWECLGRMGRRGSEGHAALGAIMDGMASHGRVHAGMCKHYDLLLQNLNPQIWLAIYCHVWVPEGPFLAGPSVQVVPHAAA